MACLNCIQVLKKNMYCVSRTDDKELPWGVGYSSTGLVWTIIAAFTTQAIAEKYMNTLDD